MLSDVENRLPAIDRERRIVSTLPVDDAEFREIVVGFVGKLLSEVAEMQSAWEEGNLDDVARIGHWLKGAAGTLGFRDFTEPGVRLMTLAREKRLEELGPVLELIQQMVDSIDIPVGATEQ